MSSATESLQRLELHSGDRMTREEFHRIYSRMPENIRAELVQGVVYVASPLRRKHGTHHISLGIVFGIYEGRTHGVESGDNASILLGDDSEPQPDLYLRILENFGGQSSISEDDYVVGPPEMLAEIALSSQSIDLHSKHDDYRRAGVKEYLVVCVNEERLRAFDLQNDVEKPIDPDGVYRSTVFPGLWIHAAGLFARNHTQLISTLEQGLESPEHTAFVHRIADRHR